jgi:SAM-dependent methyltransferase
MTLFTASTTEPVYPAAQKYLGDVAKDYLVRRKAHPTWQWEQAQVEEFIRAHGGTPSVLDVPFGTGRYTDLYLKAGWTVHGCDISPDMISEAAREMGAEAFSRCDVKIAPAEQMPYDTASMDVIVSSRFIQWLPTLAHVDRVFAEFARVGRGQMLVQLRIPGEPRKAQADQPASLARFRKRLAKAFRRRFGTPPAPRARIVCHPEPDLLALAADHGWVLTQIGVECPTSRGLRFYKFRRV